MNPLIDSDPNHPDPEDWSHLRSPAAERKERETLAARVKELETEVLQLKQQHTAWKNKQDEWLARRFEELGVTLECVETPDGADTEILTNVRAERLEERITIDRSDYLNPATNCLNLLGVGVISISKACEWLSAYFATGEKQPIAEMPAEYPAELLLAMPFELYKQNQELKRLFDIQWSRMLEADAIWREAHPGKELVIPDLGALLTWLLEERHRLLGLELGTDD
jgi:hypothetical protein